MKDVISKLGPNGRIESTIPLSESCTEEVFGRLFPAEIHPQTIGDAIRHAWTLCLEATGQDPAYFLLSPKTKQHYEAAFAELPEEDRQALQVKMPPLVARDWVGPHVIAVRRP